MQASNPTQDQLQTSLDALQGALAHLLIGNLNARTSRETGPASNQALLRSFSSWIARLKPTHFFDIGANDAGAACSIKQMLPECEVWAFEANPEIHARFAANVARQGVNYLNLAITASPGPVTLYAPRTLSRAIVDGEVIELASVEPEITGKTSLLKRNEDATYFEFSVDGLRLDDFLASQRIDGDARDLALWIDVEGAAAQVLAGATTALARTALILIESENYEFWTGQQQAGEIARTLIAAGFLPLERDREYGDQQFNTLFVHHTLAALLDAATYTLSPSQAPHPACAQPTQLTVASAPSHAAPSRRRPSYRSLASQLAATIPVYIPVFNNPTYARNMLDQCTALGLEHLCLVDNGSNSHAMLQFLDDAEFRATVIRTGENRGPREIVANLEHHVHLPELFCITDPDLQFHADLPVNFLSSLVHLTRELEIGKAGFALRIDDADQMDQRRFIMHGKSWHAAEWELQYWAHPLGNLRDGNPVFRAHIDTTFAVYNKKYFRLDTFFEAVRVAGNYTCRHLPWYRRTMVGAEELSLYRATQQRASCGA